MQVGGGSGCWMVGVRVASGWWVDGVKEQMVAGLKRAESDYVILVEPLPPTDGGGWFATVSALPGKRST
jgi:hypothetical protein